MAGAEYVWTDLDGVYTLAFSSPVISVEQNADGDWITTLHRSGDLVKVLTPTVCRGVLKKYALTNTGEILTDLGPLTP